MQSIVISNPLSYFVRAEREGIKPDIQIDLVPCQERDIWTNSVRASSPTARASLLRVRRLGVFFPDS